MHGATEFQFKTNHGMMLLTASLACRYSCVGVYKNGRVEIIANDQGNRITPSYVAFTDSERLIGDSAKNQATTNPHRTVYDVKRLIGRKYDSDLMWPALRAGSSSHACNLNV